MKRITLTTAAITIMLVSGNAGHLWAAESQAPDTDIWTAAATGNVEAIEQHIAAGADLNAKGPNGSTPLIMAAVYGQTEAVRLLVKNGAELEARNNQGATALLTASFFCYPEIVKLLLDNGAEVNAQNSIGQTPLDTVMGEWTPELGELYTYFAKVILQTELDIEKIQSMRPVVADILRSHGGKVASESVKSKKSDTITLFNGKDFQGWYIWSEDAEADPKDVWKIQDGAILCTGVPTGFLRTAKEYTDYKLAFEWRWPGETGNSGVLLHMSGEEKVWPRCMEAQLMHERAGDLIGMGCDFNEDKNKEGGFISYAPRMNDSNEKKPGDWNSYEIVCEGDTVEVTINGQLQNKATGVTIRKGFIGFQSEGIPIMLRNIKLTPLKSTQ